MKKELILIIKMIKLTSEERKIIVNEQCQAARLFDIQKLENTFAKVGGIALSGAMPGHISIMRILMKIIFIFIIFLPPYLIMRFLPHNLSPNPEPKAVCYR
jgi:hypothetical protein